MQCSNQFIEDVRLEEVSNQLATGIFSTFAATLANLSLRPSAPANYKVWHLEYHVRKVFDSHGMPVPEDEPPEARLYGILLMVVCRAQENVADISTAFQH